MAEPEGRPADIDLIRQVQAGDTAAYDELMQRYARSVYKVTYAMMRSHADADDMAQETFIRAFRSIDRYDATWRFYTWLRRIAVNVCLNELKRRNRFRLVPLPQSDGDAESVDVPDPNPTAVDSTLRRDLDAALLKLPDDQRTVFVLRVNEEMSYNEISELLGIPVGTVMSRLNRARTRLRELLREYLPNR